jgi:hypothetical protein
MTEQPAHLKKFLDDEVASVLASNSNKKLQLFDPHKGQLKSRSRAMLYKHTGLAWSLEYRIRQ